MSITIKHSKSHLHVRLPLGGMSDRPVVAVVGRLALDLVDERVLVMLVDKDVEMLVGVEN